MSSRIVKARRAGLNLEEPRCRFAKVLIPSSMPAPGDANFTIRLPARVRARIVSSSVSLFFATPSDTLGSTPQASRFTLQEKLRRHNRARTPGLAHLRLVAHYTFSNP